MGVYDRPPRVPVADLVARARGRAVLAAAHPPPPLPPPPPPPAEVASGHTARCPQCNAVLEPVLNARRIEVFPPHPNRSNPRRNCIGTRLKVTSHDRRAVIRGEP